MGMAELAERTRQEARKRLDRAGLAGRGTGLHEPAGPGPDPDRFFAGATAESAALLRRRLPEAAAEIVERADRIRAGKFDLLGYRALSFGDPVDWHLDPVSGVRAPSLHWSRLDSLDRDQVGDSKVVWELNRHQWLVTLGQAYSLTGDEAYAEAFAGHVRRWLEANPPGRGINWASSLEAALRLISWLWALALFGSAPAADDVAEEMRDGVVRHALRVERHLSHHFAPNTHLTGEALGLLYAGLALPEARHAERWRERGRSILIEQTARQIRADGVHFEQATCYARYTAEILLHALILGARNGVGFPDPVSERLQALLDFLLWTRRPDGSMPAIGDADGGWLLPLHPRAPDELRGVFSTAAAWFGRADYAWAAGATPAPETLWLLGPSGWEVFDAIGAAPPAGPASRLFADGGYAVLGEGWSSESHQMILAVGPLGLSGHGHADLLSVQVAVFGEPLIVDPGTYAYAAEPGWRDHFRGTAAHSTVTVDDRDQAGPVDLFKWRTRPRSRVLRWEPAETSVLADAEHHAYDGVVHRRAVTFDQRLWIVADDLTGAGKHAIALRFQLAPRDVTQGGDWVRVRGAAGRGLLIRAFAPVPLTAELLEGWVSPDYGVRRPAPLLAYSATAPLPLRILTLLLPVVDITTAPPDARALLDEAGALCGVRLEPGGDEVRLDG